MTFLLFLCVGYLFLWQIQCLLQNVTTIESHYEELKRTVLFQLTFKNPFKKQFWKANINEIMGEKTLYWFLPVN